MKYEKLLYATVTTLGVLLAVLSIGTSLAAQTAIADTGAAGLKDMGRVMAAWFVVIE